MEQFGDAQKASIIRPYIPNLKAGSFLLSSYAQGKEINRKGFIFLFFFFFLAVSHCFSDSVIFMPLC